MAQVNFEPPVQILGVIIKCRGVSTHIYGDEVTTINASAGWCVLVKCPTCGWHHALTREDFK